MRKYNSRVNKLFIKTHTLISNNDLCVLRDISKVWAADTDTPINFFEILNEVQKLGKNLREAKDIESATKIREQSLPLFEILSKPVYEALSKWCEEKPDGIWCSNSDAEPLLKIIRNKEFYLNYKKYI